MPHLGRRFASTIGPPQELRARPPIPKIESALRTEQAKPGDGPKRLGLESISMSKWHVPADQIYKQLFGKEAERDPHTQQLVHPRSSAAAQSPGVGQAHAAGTRIDGFGLMFAGLAAHHANGAGS